MKFLNKRTGNTLVVPCRLEGPDWEEITETKMASPDAKAPGKGTPKKTAAKKPARKGADA